MSGPEIKLLINRGLVKRERFAKIASAHVEPEFFEERYEQIFFILARKLWMKHHALPTKDMIYVEVSQVAGIPDAMVSAVKAYADSVYNFGDFDQIKDDWLEAESEKWCQARSVFKGFEKGLEILDGKVKENGQVVTASGIIPLMKKAINFVFKRDIGHDYQENAPERFDIYHHKVHKLPFKIEEFNKMTDGGFEKKTLNVFLGGTGKGKSLVKCSLASDFFRDGKKILYITLEMADWKIAQRIDANLLNIPMKELKMLPRDRYLKKIDELGIRSKIIVKSYPTGTAHEGHFRILLDELANKKDFIPDVIIVDYMGIAVSSRYRRSESMYQIGKGVAEELRAVMDDYNACGITSAQLNRTGHGSSDADMTEISESHGINMTADWIGALIQPEDLFKLSQLKIKQLKTRYDTMGNVTNFLVNVDYPKMRIYDNQSRWTNSPGTGGAPIAVPKTSVVPSKADMPPWEVPVGKGLTEQEKKEFEEFNRKYPVGNGLKKFEGFKT